MSSIFPREPNHKVETGMKIIIGVGSPCLQLMFADPPNERLVLQVVHRPPAQHLLRQAGGRHHGPSLLIQAGQHVQECTPGKFEEN